MGSKESNTKLKGAIFDLDGVIVDTVNMHFRAWKKMFSEYNKEFSFEDYKSKVDGIPRVDGARAILTFLDEKKLEEAATRKQGYFLGFLDKEKVKVHQGTIDLVEGLKKEAVKVSVISSSKNCRHILENAGLIDRFDIILGGNDVKEGKPNPDIFLLAAKKMGLNPLECVVFEDAILGVEAAKRAGMKCVGIDRYGNAARLTQADLVVNDLSKVGVEGIKLFFN